MLEGTRILAVHHDPSLTGAALLFESVIEGLIHTYGAIISQSFPKPGAMVARARVLGPVQVGHSRWDGRPRTFLDKVAGRLGYREPGMTWDLIFANSIASLGTVERLRARHGGLQELPLVVFVHESSLLLHEYDFPATQRMLSQARLIFAVSAAVRKTLEEVIQPTAAISVVNGFLLERQGTGSKTALPSAVQDAIDSGARILGGVGTVAWYKGTDLFIAVAKRIRQLLPQQRLAFIWMGQEQFPEVRRLLERDIERAGLSQVVIMPGQTHDPRAFFDSLSLFLLPSREDSWPLVMLEAAQAGVPIVCFQRAGGAEEFVAHGGGTAVPYLDVEAMAQAAVRYLCEPALMERDSRIARQLVLGVGREEQIRKIASGIAQMMLSPVSASERRRGAPHR